MPADPYASAQMLIRHLEGVASSFNTAAGELGLPVLLSDEKAIVALESGAGAADAIAFAERADDAGVLHPAQIQTVVACLGELMRDDRRWGHVLGAMQSGKTATALSLL